MKNSRKIYLFKKDRIKFLIFLTYPFPFSKHKQTFNPRHRLQTFDRITNKRKLLLWYFVCRHSLVSPLIASTAPAAAVMMKKNWWNDLFYGNNFSFLFSLTFFISFFFPFLDFIHFYDFHFSAGCDKKMSKLFLR